MNGMKSKSSFIIYILTLILFILVLHLAIVNKVLIIPTSNNSGFALEPKAPTNISDTSFDLLPLPDNEVPINQVLEKGKNLSFKFIYNNPDWERPAYKNYWHSEYGRWSYVPNRIHYALHRVFSTYATASIYYDFIHDLGIAEESEHFNKYEFTSPFDYLQIVVMNTSIEKVITYENQIVIVGEPQRTGLQAIVIPNHDIKPIGNSNIILIQLVTPDGYEIDYTSFMYELPI